jgi:hypothetical protein
MPAFTVQQLVTRAMSQADMRDNFVSETEWIAWANQERQALQVFLARVGWILELHTFTGTITSSGWDVTLDGSAPESMVGTGGNYVLESTADPDAFVIMAICGVWEVGSDSQVRRLRMDNAVDFLLQLPSATTAQSHASKFRVFTRNFNQLNFNFYPTPQVGETYLIQALLAPLTLTSLASTITLPMGWEEWLVLKLARRALIKEESDPSKVEAMIREIEQQIEELSWSKNLAEVPAVRNVDQQVYHWDTNLITPPWSSWAWI